MSLKSRLSTVAVISTLVVAGGASTALAHGGGKGGNNGNDNRQPSKTALTLKGLKNGDLTVGNDFTAAGTLSPYVKGQKVTVLLHRGKKTIERKTLNVRPKGKSGKIGKFSFSDKLIKPGRYSVEAFHDKNKTLGGSKDETRRFHIRYPDLNEGNSGDAVKIFNKLLGNLGYVNDENHSYNSATSRAVLAFRKVNNMDRKYSASVTIFKMLAKGKGGYRLKHPEAGKHVEADISRQVMVLAQGDKVDEIYTISSGKSTTPTILGEFHFYRKDPGYNSEGMYYSAYFEGGYATHGYADVPDYPASHGCLRNPIPDSVHIYNWIDIGDPIFIYH
jgi:L,D-transpeptidase-like protein/putative peptidoglycan binding protein